MDGYEIATDGVARSAGSGSANRDESNSQTRERVEQQGRAKEGVRVAGWGGGYNCGQV